MAKMPLAEQDNVARTYLPDRTAGAPPQHVIVLTVQFKSEES